MAETYILSNKTDFVEVANAIRTKGGTKDALSFPDGFVSAITNLEAGGSSAAPNLQSKTVSPATTKKTITPDTGYDGLSDVTINAIQTETKTVSPSTTGKVEVTPSTSEKYLTKVTINQINNQSKTVTPSESTQTVFPGSGYDGLSSVTVNAVSSSYVGSAITRQGAQTITPSSNSQIAVPSGVYTTGATTVAAVPATSKTITANGTYTPVSGNYYSEVIVSVPNDEVTYDTPSITVSEDTGTITAVANGKSATKTMTTQGATTITPKTTSQTALNKGIFTTGAVTVSAVPTETKSVTPSTTSQTITPTSGKFLSSVSVDAISTETKSITSNGTYSPTDGSYFSQVTVNVPSTSVSYDTPTINVSTGGLITATANGVSNTKQLTTKAATTITPKSTSQTAVAKEVYTTGAITVAGDSNLVASNIKSGTSIFGVTGTYSGDSSGSTTITESTVVTDLVMSCANSSTDVTPVFNSDNSHLVITITPANITSLFKFSDATLGDSFLNGLILNYQRFMNIISSFTATSLNSNFSQTNIKKISFMLNYFLRSSTTTGLATLPKFCLHHEMTDEWAQTYYSTYVSNIYGAANVYYNIGNQTGAYVNYPSSATTATSYTPTALTLSSFEFLKQAFLPLKPNGILCSTNLTTSNATSLALGSSGNCVTFEGNSTSTAFNALVGQIAITYQY